MPYNGPSKGCVTCKQRHVRCDEGRPLCKNCQNLGIQCPGYNNDLIFRFHNESQKARQKRSEADAPSSGPGSSQAGDSQPGSAEESPSRNDFYQPTRKKRFAPKVKSGCLTCKQRRVKCDELKPTCKRCQAVSRKCEYLPVKLWLFNVHQAKSRAFSSSTDSDVSSPAQPLLPYYGTPEEKKYLHSFLRLTAPWLSRYFPSDFFKVLLPQSSWQHSALRHALVAVAMATEEVRLPMDLQISKRKTWHYYEAVRSLSSDLFVTTETILLTCMMFWLHDNISNNATSAMTHLVGALKIINERRSGKRRLQPGDLISSQIEPTLVFGLIFSAATVDKNYLGPYDPEIGLAIRERLDDAKYTHQFDDMEEVRSEIGLVIRSFSYAVKRHLPDETGHIDRSRPTYAELRAFLEKWFRAFSRVITGVSVADKRLLEAHYICATVAVDCYEFGVHSQELRDPKSLARFEYMLDQVESLAPEDLVQAPLAQDVHLAVIPLLTSVARMCPEGELKTRAIKQLKSMDRVEGLWNSAVAAELLERVEEMDQALQPCSAHESAIVLTPLSDTSYFYNESQMMPNLDEVQVA